MVKHFNKKCYILDFTILLLMGLPNKILICGLFLFNDVLRYRIIYVKHVGIVSDSLLKDASLINDSKILEFRKKIYEPVS